MDAEAICVGYGGNLVSIHDDDLHEFIIALRGTGGQWIGLKKTLTGYAWSDGSSLDYNAENIQDNGNGPYFRRSNNYVSNRQWISANHGYKQVFVCQMYPRGNSFLYYIIATEIILNVEVIPFIFKPSQARGILYIHAIRMAVVWKPNHESGIP